MRRGEPRARRTLPTAETATPSAAGEDDLHENRSPGELVGAYLEARAAFRAADAAVTALLQVIQRVGADLGDAGGRGRVIFLGTGIGLPWPNGAAHHARPVADGEWPDAARLQQALATWHSGHAAARAAWKALPPQLQAGLPHPPAELRTDKLPPWNCNDRDRPRPAVALMEE